MARSMQGHSLVAQSIYPQSCSSDGVTGAGLALDGYSRAFIGCFGGLVATGDSDDTVTFTVSKNIVTNVASDAASSDWVVITAATQTLGPSADTDTVIGQEFIDLDFAEHGLSTGLLRLGALSSEGCAASVTGIFQFYRETGKNGDSAMTITKPASS
jgi:hypothetical protein